MGGEGEKKWRSVWRGQSSVGLFLVQFLSIPDFSWSPTNKMACWELGRDSIPAKITIIEIPSKKEVSEVGASDMAQTVPPFWGEREKGLWVVVGVTGGSVGAG